MDLLSELPRLQFVVDRDGPVEAMDWARKTLAIYRAAAKSRRRTHGRTDRFREEYVESAVSLRHLLRNVL